MLTTTKKKKQKRKPEYVEGTRARKSFEGAMKVLFQAPKTDSKNRKKARTKPLFDDHVPAQD